jgi:response regulator RpfG family c-di-GMP phosphodiesterase
MTQTHSANTPAPASAAACGPGQPERLPSPGRLDAPPAQRRVLIVDDDRDLRTLLGAVLAAHYEIAFAADGHEALGLFESFAPDLVLLDVLMPGLDGLEVCRCIKGSPRGRRVQVIMVSGSSSREDRRAALLAGADDYVVKPLRPREMPQRIELHFRLQYAWNVAHSVRSEIEQYNADARDVPHGWAEQLAATEDAALLALAKLAEARDEVTGRHLFRMRSYCQILAEELARGEHRAVIDCRFLHDLYRSSPLHDIGKVAISDAILRKPGPLTPEEFEIMKRHTVIGAEIIEGAMVHSPGADFLTMAAIIVRYHHERFAGRGYPVGLVGKEIPLAARIAALADVYDALTSQRPYRGPVPPSEARELICNESGRHFDPVIVQAFVRCYDRFLVVPATIDRQPPPVTEPLDAADAPATVPTAGETRRPMLSAALNGLTSLETPWETAQ